MSEFIRNVKQAIEAEEKKRKKRRIYPREVVEVEKTTKGRWLLAIIFLIIGILVFILGKTILDSGNIAYLYNFYETYYTGHITFNFPLEDPRFIIATLLNLIQAEEYISTAWVYLALSPVYFSVGIGYLLIKKGGWFIGAVGGVMIMVTGFFVFGCQFTLFSDLHLWVASFLIPIGMFIFLYLVTREMIRD